MKLSIPAGTTSKRIGIFIQDSSSTTGAGLASLTSGSSGLVCYSWIDTDGNVAATQQTLQSATRGTWTTRGFIEKDGTNMPGAYEFGIPDALIASGVKWAIIMFKGATNMAPLILEIEVTAVSNQDSVRGGMTALPNAAAGASGGLIINGSNSGTVTLAALTITGAMTYTGNVSFADGLTVSAPSTANRAGVTITGNGTGAGVSITGGNGATGNGVDIIANSTNGTGLNISGKGNKHGILSTGGATGNGANLTGGSSSGAALLIQQSTSGNAITILGASNGIDITAAGSFGITVEAANGIGINIDGGGTFGVNITGQTDGVKFSSLGTGNGLTLLGGGTGHGLLSTSGSGTTGDGLKLVAASTNGNGLNLVGKGTGNGLLSTGGAGAGGDGAEFVSGGAGVDIRGAITGNLTGNVSGSIGSVTAGVSVAAGGISSTAFAANAIDSAALATTAVNEIADGILARAMAAESYATDGAVPTLSQCLYMLLANLTQFAITGTTISVKKLDGTTEAMTYTIDNAAAPTLRDRTT